MSRKEGKPGLGPGSGLCQRSQLMTQNGTVIQVCPRCWMSEYSTRLSGKDGGGKFSVVYSFGKHPRLQLVL